MTTKPEVFRPEIVAGDRVYLTLFDRSDAPLMAKWLSDLEVTTHLGAIGQVFGVDDEEEWIERVRRDRQNPTFGIMVREEQRLIGSIGLKAVDTKHGRAELGITIGEKAEWGKGYGSEAARLIVDYGFTLCSLHVIWLKLTSFNKRAHRSYLKAGFKDVGRIRNALTIGAQRYDELLMDITREDFGPSRVIQTLGIKTDA